jgi:hypothetical protein
VGQVRFGFSHRFSFEQLVGVVHKTIEDGIGDGRFADVVVPLLDRELTGDEGGSPVVAVIA